MHLSIVECSDYKNYSKNTPPPERKIINGEVEVIGPVLAENVAAMRNLGAEMAQGQWIFFKDADCQVSYDDILAIIEESPSTSAIGGIYKTENSNYLGQAYHKIQKQWVMQGIDFIQKDRHLLGGALLVKKDVFKEIGGFNREIGWGGEETEFITRMHAHGLKTEVDYRLEVAHDKNMSWKAFLKRAWFQNFNKVYYQIKDKGYSSSLNYLQVSPRFIFPVLVFFMIGTLARITGQICRLIEKAVAKQHS